MSRKAIKYPWVINHHNLRKFLHNKPRLKITKALKLSLKPDDMLERSSWIINKKILTSWLNSCFSLGEAEKKWKFLLIFFRSALNTSFPSLCRSPLFSPFSCDTELSSFTSHFLLSFFLYSSVAFTYFTSYGNQNVKEACKVYVQSRIISFSLSFHKVQLFFSSPLLARSNFITIHYEGE